MYLSPTGVLTIFQYLVTDSFPTDSFAVEANAPAFEPEMKAVVIDPLYSGLVQVITGDIALFLSSKWGLIIIPVSATALAGMKSLTILNITLSKNFINLIKSFTLYESKSFSIVFE